MAEEILESQGIDDSQQQDQQVPQPPKKLNVKDFAAKIKAKYPTYSNVDDNELVSKMLDKYPTYKYQVESPVLKKNETSGQTSKTGAQTDESGIPTVSLSPSPSQKTSQPSEEPSQPSYNEKSWAANPLNPMSAVKTTAQQPQQPKPKKDWKDVIFDKSSFHTPNQTDATYVAKPVTGEKIEQVEKGRANMQLAIDNTTERALKSKGLLTTKNSPTYIKQRKKVEDAVKNGNASYTLDPITKQPALSQNTNFADAAFKSLKAAINDEDEADEFVNNMTTKQRTDYANSKIQQGYTEEGYAVTSNPRVGSILGIPVSGAISDILTKTAETGGGAIPFVTKMTAGTMAGAGLVALAPETGGISLAGVPAAIGFALTTPSAVNQGGKNEVMRRYNELKKQNQGQDIPDEELMKQAESGLYSGEITGGLTNLAFSAIGLKPVSAEAAPVIEKTLSNILKSTAKGTAKSGLELGGISAAGTAVQEAEAGIEDKRYKKNAGELIGDVSNSFVGGLTTGALLHLTTQSVLGTLSLPGQLKSAVKYGLSKESPIELQKILSNNEAIGNVPSGTTDAVMKDINSYNQALNKTSQDLTPETQSSVAGLIQKRDNLMNEMSNKDQTQIDSYLQQIDAINKQIKNITETNDPSSHEVNDITGQKLDGSIAEVPEQKKEGEQAYRVDYRDEQGNPAHKYFNNEEESKVFFQEQPTPPTGIEGYYEKLPKGEAVEIIKTQKNDKENITGVPSEVGVGQEPIKAQPVEGGGTQEISSSGVLQAQGAGGEGKGVEQKVGEEIRKRGLDRLFPVEIDETTPEGKQLAKEKKEQEDKIKQLESEFSKQAEVGKEALKKMSDADIENRLTEIQNIKNPTRIEDKEFDILEKEMENRERNSVFNVTLDKVNDAVDALMQKEKDMPNGWGAFIEKRDARETKEIANKYLNAKELTDNELKEDFKNAIWGNPATWYADGLKLRESMKEAANRGIDIQEMIKEIEKEFIKDGYTAEDAHFLVARKLKPIFEGAIEAKPELPSIEAELPKQKEQPIAEVSKQQLEETNNLLNDGDKIRKEGKYVKDGVEYVRNEKGLGIKSEEGGDVRFTSEPGGGGVSVPFKYKLIEAETLQPSHQDGIRNPNHFIWEAQPKNRNDVGSIQAEESFANNPRFEEMGENTNAYSGAPVVNERNEVIQGNNRSAGLRKGYQRGNEIYKKALSENAEKFGFSKEQVDGMKNPILVREVATSDKGAIELGNYDVKDLESGGKRRLDPIAITRRMPFELKGRVADILFKGEETLNQAIRSNTKRLMELIDPYLNQSQRNTILKDGNLTDAGIKDLESVVQHFLFDGGDPALSDLYENLSGTQKEALRKSLPHIFSTGTEKSIVPEVQEAIIALNDFGASDVDNFENWLSQSDLFNDGMTPKDKYSPTSIKIAEILHNAKTQKEVISHFGQYAEAVKDKPATMFEEATKGVSKKEGIKQIFKTEYDESKKPQISQGSSKEVLGAKEEKPQPIAEGSAEPKKPIKSAEPRGTKPTAAGAEPPIPPTAELKGEPAKPSEPTKVGKFEAKAQKIAENIKKAELPDWLSISDKDVKKSGLGAEELKQMLADAVINMGKLLDKGVEFSQALKESVKDLVNAHGEENRENIEKGFERYYKDNVEPIIVGASHESLRKTAERLGLEQPNRGTFLTPEEQTKRGEALIKAGVDAEQVGENFKKDKLVSPDVISIARAHLKELLKKAESDRKEFGINSEEYKKSVEEYKKWQDDVMKPMGTQAGGALSALQGEMDLDTGSFTAVENAYRNVTGKEFTAEQQKKAQELTNKVTSLTKEVEDLKSKLTDALNKAEKAEDKQKNIKQKAYDVAKRLRKNAKLSRPDSFSAATPASLVWDGAVEITAKTIEAGGTIAQAIADGVEHIKNSKWYNSLTEDQKKKAEKEFTDWHNEEIGESEEQKKSEQRIKSLEKQLEDLKEGKEKAKPEKRELTDKEKELKEQIQKEKDNIAYNKLIKELEGKKDSNFTIDQAKSIWEYAKKNYLDKGVEDFDNMVNGVATDLGITPKQVRDALTLPKGTKRISDEMYRKQRQRNDANNYVKQWVKAEDNSKIVKFLKSIPNAFFALKTFGHGTVGFITHAGMDIFDYRAWKNYFPNFIKQFKFAYGDTAKYEQAMADLVRDKDYIFWLRNGLAVDPSKGYSEYEGISKIFGKLGEAGDRGFNALKVYRLEQAKNQYNKLSAAEKSDPEVAKRIAESINRSTGTTDVEVPKIVSTAFFAPKLVASQFERLTTEPANAMKTLVNTLAGKQVSTADKVAAKIVAKKAGRLIALYASSLAANQAILSLSGSNQKINFTDPDKKDFLKFKMGDKVIDLSAGIIPTLNFIGGLLYASVTAKSKPNAIKDLTANFIYGKLSPFAGTAKDVLTQHTFSGDVMPFSNDKPAPGKKKLTWKEYLATSQTPIPIAEAVQDITKEMKEQGMTDPNINQVLNGILMGTISGFTGAKVKDEPKSFTKKEYPAFTEAKLDIPQLGSREAIRVDINKEHPEGIMTTEEYDKFVPLVQKHSEDRYNKLIKEEKRSISRLQDLESKDELSVGEKVEKSKIKKRIQNKISTEHTRAIKQTKYELKLNK